MKRINILILLLVLISSLFIIEIVKEDDSVRGITGLTTKIFDKINTKATAVLATLAISVDAGPPAIFISSPINKTYNYNNTLELNFTVIDDNLDKIYYNIDNGQNTTITGNTTFSVNLSSSHTLTLYANDTLGRLNSSSVTFSINISKPWNITFTEFTGTTTNFTNFNKTQQANLSNVILENPNHGKIKYNQNINIEEDTDLDSYGNISFNRVEIQSEFIPKFNRSATITLYNLTFSNPRVLIDGSLCPSTICSENSYLNGQFSFNVTRFTVYSSEETPSDGGTGGTGGSGGGGGGGKTVTDLIEELPIILSTDLIKVSLLQGETKREVIEITNNGDNTLQLTIDLLNTKDLVIFPGGVSSYELTLNPGEKKTLQITFNAPKNYSPGVYIGRIIITSGQTAKTITAIIEVESLKKIFDIDLKLDKHKVVRGDGLLVQINLFNLGNDVGRVDTNIEVGIKDLEGNIISKKDLVAAVETQASLVENLNIPGYLEEGRYVIYATVNYGDEVGTAS